MIDDGRIIFSGKRPLGSASKNRLRSVLESLLRDHDQPGAVHLVFVDDAAIRRAHRQFFDDDTVTDVITFPMRSRAASGSPAPRRSRTAPGADASVDPLEGELLGEILVSVDTARRESASRGLPLERELALYSIHGVLHVLGYDDCRSTERRRMRRMERRYLDRF